MKQSLINRLLLVRFFRDLKSRQPKLFYFCLILIALQLLCTAAKLEATPFMLYGMFSEKYPETATISRLQILVDGKPLSNLPLPSREKLLMEGTAENYFSQWQNGKIDPLQTRIESKYPFFTNSPYYPVFSKHIYNHPQALTQFETWFKNKIHTAVGSPIQKVTLVRETYSALPYSAPIKLVQIDTLRQF